MTDPTTYAQAQQKTHLAELIDFLKIPSISTQPEHATDVHRAASWLADKMTQAGLENAPSHRNGRTSPRLQ